MKKIGMLVAVLFVCVGAARAYEVPENPDRKISFGFNYDRSTQHSDYEFAGFRKSDFSKASGDSFLLDARVPLTPFLTFSIRGGLANSTTDIFTGEKVSYSGYDVGAGVRLYLP